MVSLADSLVEGLREAAQSARVASYPRYSGFRVLAAVERIDGRLYGGANVEVVNYSLTKHAEEAAVMAAISDGALALGDRWLRTVYVVGAPPCGSCRQFLSEWAIEDAQCVIDKPGLEEVTVRRLADLMPEAFKPEMLPDRRTDPDS